ncbi:NADH:flavin oxidoreductase [Streptomyces sp. NPDC059894]|uniref:NADH:flavin oxidoreductase n=1 Tax=unclassified Streptomyces TaxID=2593676 RepID=UPI0036614617
MTMASPSSTSTVQVADPALAPLFTPFEIGSLRLPNRLVMAPMTRAASPGGVPGTDVAEYYARRARGGIGLIVTEGTVIGHAASAVPDGIPFFAGAEALAGWSRVVAAVHAAGGRIVPQLWHVGAYDGPDAARNPAVEPVGPSGLGLSGAPLGTPMTEADIASVVEAFARAVTDAKQLGFDGIELHGAHGFLIDQFLWSHTNRRTDRYGGSATERSRFGAEVVAACRAAVGPDFPIILRISQWKMTDFEARIANAPSELEALLTPLAEAGVDAFQASTRRFWQPEFAASKPELGLAGWAKKVTGKPSIAVGSVGLEPSDFQNAFAGQGAGVAPLDRATALIKRGDADLLAIGRLLVSDPEWAAKVRDGRIAELLPFDPAALASLT